MVLDWFFGNEYTKFNSKLSELAVLEQIVVKEIKKKHLEDAKEHEEEFKALLNDLLARFQSQSSDFYGVDSSLAAKLAKIFAEIGAALKSLPSIKSLHELMEEGVSASEVKEDLEQVKKSLKKIRKKILEAEPIVKQLREKKYGKKKKEKKGKKKRTGQFPLDPDIRIFTTEYKAKLVQYNSMREDIEAVRLRIEQTPDYVGTLHEPWKTGRYAGYRHARVTGNLRIMYLFNTEKVKNKKGEEKEIRTITYETILTKNDLDNS